MILDECPTDGENRTTNSASSPEHSHKTIIGIIITAKSVVFPQDTAAFTVGRLVPLSSSLFVKIPSRTECRKHSNTKRSLFIRKNVKNELKEGGKALGAMDGEAEAAESHTR